MWKVHFGNGVCPDPIPWSVARMMAAELVVTLASALYTTPKDRGDECVKVSGR